MDDVEAADSAGKEARTRMMPVQAMMSVAQQAVYFTGSRLDEGKLRPVNYISIGGWLMLSVILLIGLTTGGGWLRGATIRDLMNDENTRATVPRVSGSGSWGR